MNQADLVRFTALQYAFALNSAHGVMCEGCLLETAENLVSFVMGGPYTIGHLTPVDDEPDPVEPEKLN